MIILLYSRLSRCFVINVLLLAASSSASQILTSPQVTSWGIWGEFEKCPEGTKVVAVQLRTEPWNFWNTVSDDTCLNGIRLYCGTPKLSNYSKVISSSVGEWGDWGKVFTCNGDGYLIGFMMKTEEADTPLMDESAANNMRILCSGSQNGFMELDGEEWGEWTNPRMCDGQHEFVCGIQTQVQEYQGICKFLIFYS
jgi:hypothetical protein